MFEYFFENLVLNNYKLELNLRPYIISGLPPPQAVKKNTHFFSKLFLQRERNGPPKIFVHIQTLLQVVFKACDKKTND